MKINRVLQPHTDEIILAFSSLLIPRIMMIVSPKGVKVQAIKQYNGKTD